MYFDSSFLSVCGLPCARGHPVSYARVCARVWLFAETYSEETYARNADFEKMVRDGSLVVIKLWRRNLLRMLLSEESNKLVAQRADRAREEMGGAHSAHPHSAEAAQKLASATAHPARFVFIIIFNTRSL